MLLRSTHFQPRLERQVLPHGLIPSRPFSPSVRQRATRAAVTRRARTIYRLFTRAIRFRRANGGYFVKRKDRLLRIRYTLYHLLHHVRRMTNTMTGATLLRHLLPNATRHFYHQRHVRQPFTVTTRPLTGPLQGRLCHPTSDQSTLSLQSSRTSRRLPLVLARRPSTPTVFRNALRGIIPTIRLSTRNNVTTTGIRMAIPRNFPYTQLAPRHMNSTTR